MRSHHGCLTCRQRKLKCDETRPKCGPCAKSNRDCVFSQDTKFRHFDASCLLERGQDRAPAERKALGDLFLKDQVWLEVPTELTYVNITNPYETEDYFLLGDDLSLNPTCNSYHHDDVPSQEANTLRTSTPTQQPASETDPVDGSQIHLISGSPEDSVSYAQLFSASSHVNGAASWSPSIESGHESSATFTPTAHESNDDVYLVDNESDPEAKVMMLQLLRHFREGPGQWMDLFDTSAHFSCKVSIRATTRPLLKSAICALAAKHLSRTQNNHEQHTARSARKSLASADDRSPNWSYHAVRYYHQAIRCLKHAIAIGGRDEMDMQRGDAESRHADTFAAVAILCIYELMNAPGNAWKAHLTALPLFSASDSTLSGSSPVTIPQSPIKGPIFWSLARQDFLCAFISETQTRLNLDHVRLWQNFGLATDENSLLLPFSPFCTADIRASTDVDEDSRSNELLWLIGKVVNFIISGDGINPEDYSRPAGQRLSLGVTQELLLQRWTKLEVELQKWYDSLPPTFSPSARTKYTGDPGAPGEVPDMDMIWYDIPMCAATMQSYHMACILLLVNRPQESTAIRSTVSARLRSYRMIQRDVLRHGKEICGISLADPPDSVRIHSVQPLFVAGQSFHEKPEQQLVLKLLSDIETELGWATHYQIRKLVDEWKVNDE